MCWEPGSGQIRTCSWPGTSAEQGSGPSLTLPLSDLWSLSVSVSPMSLCFSLCLSLLLCLFISPLLLVSVYLGLLPSLCLAGFSMSLPLSLSFSVSLTHLCPCLFLFSSFQNPNCLGGCPCGSLSGPDDYFFCNEWPDLQPMKERPPGPLAVGAGASGNQNQGSRVQGSQVSQGSLLPTCGHQAGGPGVSTPTFHWTGQGRSTAI